MLVLEEHWRCQLGIRPVEPLTVQGDRPAGRDARSGKSRYGSRVIEAVAELFVRKDISHRLLLTAASGTAAARINGVTIHSACGFSKDAPRRGSNETANGIRCSSAADLCVDGQVRMDWQEKYLLIVDEVSMLGARTLYAANERLCKLRGSTQDFGGIPVVVICGNFRQFRPVQERSILLSSVDIPWDDDKSFRAEKRREHDKRKRGIAPKDLPRQQPR